MNVGHKQGESISSTRDFVTNKSQVTPYHITDVCRYFKKSFMFIPILKAWWLLGLLLDVFI